MICLGTYNKSPQKWRPREPQTFTAYSSGHWKPGISTCSHVRVRTVFLGCSQPFSPRPRETEGAEGLCRPPLQGHRSHPQLVNQTTSRGPSTHTLRLRVGVQRVSCEGTDTQTTPGPRQAAGSGGDGARARPRPGTAWHSGGGPGEPGMRRPGARVTPSTFCRLDAHVRVCTCGRAVSRMSCGIPAWDQSSETSRKIPSLTSMEFEAPSGLTGARARLCPQGNSLLPRRCSDTAGTRVAACVAVGCTSLCVHRLPRAGSVSFTGSRSSSRGVAPGRWGAPFEVG